MPRDIYVKAIHEQYTAMLCVMCGFPNCSCFVCSKKRSLAGSSKTAHDCWIAEYGAGHVNYNYSNILFSFLLDEEGKTERQPEAEW